MRDPPDSQKEQHQVTMQMAGLRDRAALDVPATTFGVLKGGFHTHTPSIDLDQLAASRQIGNHDPHLLIARFPAHRKPGGKAMLLPNQGRAVPLLTFSGHELSPTLPERVAPLILPTHLMLLANAQEHQVRRQYKRGYSLI